jgi:ESX secretion system protein EccD
VEQHTQHRTAAPIRLRFVLGTTSTDLAIAGEVPLIELLPTILTRLGAHAANEGVEHEGWVAQRLGQPPFNEDSCADDLGLSDGETVYLRPRAHHLPPIDFDDLVAGVADQVRARGDGWTPGRSRGMLLSFGTLILLGGAAVAATTGPAWARAALAGGTALVVLLGAMLAARAAADPVSGTALAGVATCYAAVGGWFGVLAADPSASVPIRLACASAATLLICFIGLAAVADAAGLFAGAVTFVLVIGAAAAIATFSSASPAQAAAVTLVGTFIVTLMLPLIAFRLGGLSLPMLPTSPEELSQDIDPVPHDVVVDRGRATIGYLSALSVAIGAARLALATVLLSHARLWPMLLAGVLALLLLLGARHLDTTVQRWSVLIPAAWLVLGLVGQLAAQQQVEGRLMVIWPALLVLGAAVVVASARLPGRRLRPYWGRAVDILETLTAIAAVPILGEVLGIYQLVRGLSG